MDDELDYSKYDYRNEDTDNSWNEHSTKNMKTSIGKVEFYVTYGLTRGNLSHLLVKRQ